MMVFGLPVALVIVIVAAFIVDGWLLSHLGDPKAPEDEV